MKRVGCILSPPSSDPLSTHPPFPRPPEADLDGFHQHALLIASVQGGPWQEMGGGGDSGMGSFSVGWLSRLGGPQLQLFSPGPDHSDQVVTAPRCGRSCFVGPP